MVDKNGLHQNAVSWTERKVLFKDLCTMFSLFPWADLNENAQNKVLKTMMF